MEQKRHKRKEIFSVLMVSNTGKSIKKYRVSKSSFHLIAVFLFLLCAIAAGMSCWAIYVLENQAALHKQIISGEQQAQQLKEENERLSGELTKVSEELEVLQSKGADSLTNVETVVEQEPEQEGTYPNRFPSSGVALVISSYSPDQPYMSFGMQVEDSIIATEDGTVTTISSDDTYPYIIEIEHENGYQTRYMCNQEAQLNVQEGDQVTSGSELITITLENTQLDYQVFLEGEPIDPINIIDAKG